MLLLQRFLLIGFALCIPPILIISSASAQFEGHDYHGKQIWCYRRGLGPCDVSYQSVFIGTVVSVTEAAGKEKQLQIMPEEIFSGRADGLLTVTTNQGECFGDFKAGDKWLFYLQRDTKTNALLLDYASPTRPIADAQADSERDGN
jgi:hypothetical protein